MSEKRLAKDLRQGDVISLGGHYGPGDDIVKGVIKCPEGVIIYTERGGEFSVSENTTFDFVGSERRGVMSELEITLIRKRAAQRIKGKAFLHEYACPVCSRSVLKSSGDARNHPRCNSCKGVKHGGHSDPRYDIWYGMMSRCTKRFHASARYYFAKGISVCRDWQTFDGFMRWDKFSEWSPGLQLDRIDSENGYNPQNCRWVTATENVRNRDCVKLCPESVRAIRMLYWSGLTCLQIAGIFGISKSHVNDVVNFKKWGDV